MRRFLLALAALAVAAASPAITESGPTPKPAARLLASAEARAQQSGKNVLVIFHASWCGWCRKLERFLALPDVRQSIEASYEVVWLDVDERPAKKQLENPGADALYAKWSNREGLPAYAALNPAGELLARDPGVGFPVEPQEITAFLSFLRQTAPRLGPADLDRIRSAFGGAASR
jgi:thiol-disulfide isomerase/thioredoxin